MKKTWEWLTVASNIPGMRYDSVIMDSIMENPLRSTHLESFKNIYLGFLNNSQVTDHSKLQTMLCIIFQWIPSVSSYSDISHLA